ncbi:PREDICTED: non-specific lipid-transfer protein C, cotyledon-specific isoform-like [Tarenaya hassleriana]|uniref:non-specific lipid-transfer protein C, cotyledon-specific isoform-like n=1 Tax=Tarenaya hassleriana TaxID=28532 RepID=UPI00053C8D6D|nr:PREDICTED: non-specific lipid-transfer protein C, cotyledon-specific isoform-like [Tarenaya hassleriana]
MKTTTFFSMFILLSLLLATTNKAAIPCGTVNMRAAPCVQYATGRAPNPGPQCCNSLKQLSQVVKTVDDKKAACRCLKASGKTLGVQDRFLSKIPQTCGINVGFPVSTSTNCETIH